MKKQRSPKERMTNIIDGVLIIAVLIILSFKFMGSKYFLIVILVIVPFLIYALKIIFLDGLLAD